MSNILDLQEKIHALMLQKNADLAQFRGEYFARKKYLTHLEFPGVIGIKTDQYGTFIIKPIEVRKEWGTYVEVYPDLHFSFTKRKVSIEDIPIQDWNKLMIKARQILFQDDARIEQELQNELDYLTNTTTLP